MSSTTSRVCSIDGCDGKHRSRGYCYKHYLRWKRHGDPLVVSVVVGMTTEERFWHYVDKRDDGHWIWTGPSTDPANPANNYGRLSVTVSERETYGRSSFLAHRFAWQLLVGPIPEDRELDHVCRVTLCVRPELPHVEPVTHLVNMRRGEATQGPIRRGTCRRGHEYGRRRDGRRYCPTCTRESQRGTDRRSRIRAGRLVDVGTGGAQRAKTHCPQGHPYDEENTYRPPNRPNSRQCRTCTGRRPTSEQGTYPTKTHCKHGHELTAADFLPDGTRRRRCRQCEIDRTARRNAKRRQANRAVAGTPGHIGGAATNAAKTHCPQGHPLSGDNLYVTAPGGRACVTCKRAKARDDYYRKRAARQ